MIGVIYGNGCPVWVPLGGEVFVRCLGDEGGALINGINALIKGSLRVPKPLLPDEDTRRSKSATLNQSQEPDYAGTLT